MSTHPETPWVLLDLTPLYNWDSTSTADNLTDGAFNVCSGERLDVPPGPYDWIYALATSERRAEDTVYLHFTNGAIEMVWFRISDVWPSEPVRFGEVEAFRTRNTHYPRS